MIPWQGDSRQSDGLPSRAVSRMLFGMMDSAKPLPTDVDALRALIVAERAAHTAERDRLDRQNDKLRHIIKEMQRARFGRSSEKLSDDQTQLALEDVEVAVAKSEAEQEKREEASASAVDRSCSHDCQSPPAAPGASC